jgi:hypothetical protein
MRHDWVDQPKDSRNTKTAKYAKCACGVERKTIAYEHSVHQYHTYVLPSGKTTSMLPACTRTPAPGEVVKQHKERKTKANAALRFAIFATGRPNLRPFDPTRDVKPGAPPIVVETTPAPTPEIILETAITDDILHEMDINVGAIPEEYTGVEIERVDTEVHTKVDTKVDTEVRTKRKYQRAGGKSLILNDNETGTTIDKLSADIQTMMSMLEDIKGQKICVQMDRIVIKDSEQMNPLEARFMDALTAVKLMMWEVKENKLEHLLPRTFDIGKRFLEANQVIIEK